MRRVTSRSTCSVDPPLGMSDGEAREAERVRAENLAPARSVRRTVRVERVPVKTRPHVKLDLGDLGAPLPNLDGAVVKVGLVLDRGAAPDLDALRARLVQAGAAHVCPIVPTYRDAPAPQASPKAVLDPVAALREYAERAKPPAPIEDMIAWLEALVR